MDYVPIEVQRMILERVHPEAIYAAHQVNKDWNSHILENGGKMRTLRLSEKRMRILKKKWRVAFKNHAEVIALGKRLKMTLPQMKIAIQELINEVDAIYRSLELDVTSEKEKLKAPNLTDSAREEITSLLLIILCRHCRDYFEYIPFKVRKEIQRQVAIQVKNDIGFKYTNTTLAGLEALANQMLGLPVNPDLVLGCAPMVSDVDYAQVAFNRLIDNLVKSMKEMKARDEAAIALNILSSKSD